MKTPEDIERHLWDEYGVEVVHIRTPDGCKVSFNGQGHFPCSIHKSEGDAMTSNSPEPQEEPQEYTSRPPETDHGQEEDDE